MRAIYLRAQKLEREYLWFIMSVKEGEKDRGGAEGRRRWRGGGERREGRREEGQRVGGKERSKGGREEGGRERRY